MTADEIKAALRRDNPHAKPQDVSLYTAFYLDYTEAETNIREHGAIVVHPRTAAPMENPYLKVKAASAKALGAYRLKCHELWP